MRVLEMKRPSRIRRVAADLFDLILSLIVSFLLFAFVIQPIYNTATDYKKVYKDYYTAIEKTGLYTCNKNTYTCNIIEPKATDGEKLTAIDYFNYYENRVVSYYTTKEKLDDYDNIRDQSEIFVNKDGAYNLKDGVSASKVHDFYITTIKDTKSNVFDKEEANIKMASKLNNYTMSMVSFSFIPPFAIFYIVLPLFIHGGQTLGKKLFNLKVCSIKEGFELNKSTIALRQALVVVVGHFIGLFTFGISSLAFMITSIFQKEGRSIDDFLASTIVYENVDLKDVEKEDIITVEFDKKVNNKDKTETDSAENKNDNC